MLARLKGLLPFQTPEAQRLAVLFAIVYFSQGMWYLPIQTITVVLKDRGLSAGQVADFFAITIIPWLIKPAYGLLSDFLPLFGYRRKSYLLLTSAAAGLAGLALGLTGEHSYWRMAYLFTLMAVGLAFTDVLVDALMVENGKPLGLTGAFQSVQWAAITTATVIVGVLGGYLAEHRLLPRAPAESSGRPGRPSAPPCVSGTCGWWEAFSSSTPSAPPSAPPCSSTRPTCSTSLSSSS